MSRVTPEWLALREPADAAARSVELVERLRARLVGSPELVIHDLGAGTGSMGRWLAPLLPGPQHWVLHDRDVDSAAWRAVGDREIPQRRLAGHERSRTRTAYHRPS